MKKKIIVIGGCAIALILILDILFLFKEQETNNEIDYEENLIQDINYEAKVKEVIEDTQIQGMVEIHHNGFIYLFNGEHFGEYGFEMKEYTRTNINDKKQKCIDYFTKKEYDTSYVQVGDIVLGIGDLKKYTMGENDFDTKNNPLIVLKEKDYDKMKQEVIREERESIVTVGGYFDTIKEIYLKYDISDDRYSLPFALKFNITTDTKIIGTLEEGKRVKVEYKEKELELDKLEIEKIEVIEEQEKD